MVIKRHQTDNRILFSMGLTDIRICISPGWTDNKILFGLGQFDNSTYSVVMLFIYLLLALQGSKDIDYEVELMRLSKVEVRTASS